MIIDNQIFNVELMDILIELKSQLNINGVNLLHTIKDSGKDIMCSCPYHKQGMERKPSAGIRKSDGLINCFTCHETHTLPEMISYCFGHTEDLIGTWGWKWLNKNFATIQVEERKDVKVDMERNNISYKSNMGNNKLDNINNTKSVFVMEEELDKYRYYHEYWTKRGITNENIIELFDLGYSPKEDMITFPVRDIDGNCLFVAKRSVKTKFFSYPKDVEKPLYGLYELREYASSKSTSSISSCDGVPSFHLNSNSSNCKSSNLWHLMPTEVIVCESMIDCILLWQAGHYAVALNGTGSELQFEQLRKLPCRKLILATDNDEAGLKARNKIRQNVKNKLITEIEFPKEIKDIGDLGKAQRFDDIKNIKDWEVF